MPQIISCTITTAQGEVEELMVSNKRDLLNFAGLGMGALSKTKEEQIPLRHGVRLGKNYLGKRIIRAGVWWAAKNANQQGARERELSYLFNNEQVVIRNRGEICGDCGIDVVLCPCQNVYPKLTFTICIAKPSWCDLVSDETIECESCNEYVNALAVETDTTVPDITDVTYPLERAIMWNEGEHGDFRAYAEKTQVRPITMFCEDCETFRVYGERGYSATVQGVGVCRCHGVDSQKYIHVERSIDFIFKGGLDFDQRPPNQYGSYNVDENLTLLCPDATFYDAEETKYLIKGAHRQGAFENQSPILYYGDWPTLPRLEIVGRAVNPLIRHLKTGEEIQLNYTVARGEIVTIDLERRCIESSIDGSLSSALLTDYGACFDTFELIPPRPLSTCRDTNPILFMADDGNYSTALNLYFRNTYRHL